MDPAAKVTRGRVPDQEFCPPLVGENLNYYLWSRAH
jgi:hypothetical protein